MLATLFPLVDKKRVQQFREQTLDKIQNRSSINGKYENTLVLVAIKNMKYRYIQWKPKLQTKNTLHKAHNWVFSRTFKHSVTCTRQQHFSAITDSRLLILNTLLLVRVKEKLKKFLPASV